MYKTWIRLLKTVILASHQGALPSPFNNSEKWEWVDAPAGVDYDKIVIPRIDPMELRPTDPSAVDGLQARAE
jgi:hypothetical protein